MAFVWDELGFKKCYYRYRYEPQYPSGWVNCPKNEMLMCKCTNPPTRPEPSRSQIDDRYNMTYSRLFFEGMNTFAVRAENLVNTLGLEVGDTVLVGGCGFGYLVEELNKLEINAWGFDNSRYIHQKKRTESTIGVYDLDLGAPNFVSMTRNKTKINQFDYIITEDVMTSYADGELAPLFNNCDAIATKVVHTVCLQAFPEFNVKTLDQWRAIKPSHTWLNEEGLVA